MTDNKATKGEKTAAASDLAQAKGKGGKKSRRIGRRHTSPRLNFPAAGFLTENRLVSEWLP